MTTIRLPVPGSDDGLWGSLLNDFLSVEHNGDGTLKPTGTLATKYTKPAGGIPMADLDSQAQQSLANASVLEPVRFSAAVATIGTTGSNRTYAARTFSGARMRVSAAPSGASLVVAVQQSTDGTSWTTVGTLTISSGVTTEATSSFTLTQSTGNLVRLNVTSVGSLVPAMGVVVDILRSA